MFGLTPYARHNAVATSNYNWNPFAEMDALERAFFGNHDLAEFKTDIRDLGDRYLLEADLPGFRKEDIQVDVEDGYLTISAARRDEHEEKDDKGGYLRRERSLGTFSRSFGISEIDEDKISARFENGVLTLNMPKLEVKAAESRHIAID